MGLTGTPYEFAQPLSLDMAAAVNAARLRRSIEREGVLRGLVGYMVENEISLGFFHDAYRGEVDRIAAEIRAAQPGPDA